MTDRPLTGRTVLVTGATGLFGRPLVRHLIDDGNEVIAAARFTDPGVREELETAGARCVVWDLRSLDLSVLPGSVDHVFHAAAHLPVRRSDDAIRESAGQRLVFDANVQAVGRLLTRYRDARSFFYCSSGRVYADHGNEPLREELDLGVGRGMADYALSKIAAEELVRFLADQLGTDAVIARVFALYGPGGGAPTRLIRRILAGQPVPIHPNRPVHQTVMYEDDYVDKATALAAACRPGTGPLVVNFAGSEDTTVEQYCRLAAEIAGGAVEFVEDPAAPSPRRADVARMESLVGPTAVSVRTGVTRVLEHERPRRQATS